MTDQQWVQGRIVMIGFPGSKQVAASLRNVHLALTPQFTRLLVAITVVNLGKSVTLVGLPILVIERYGLGTELTNALSLRILPTIFGGVFAAWALARFDARWVAAIAMSATGVITLLIPLARSVAELNATSVAAGVASLFAGPALMALRSSVLKEEAAMRGNGFVVSAERAPYVIGPAIAAGVLLITNVSVLFIAEAIATALGAALLIGMPPVARSDLHRAGSRSQLDRWRSVLLGDARMNGYVVTGLTYTIGVHAARLLFAAIATTTFSHNPGALALMTSAMALGAVVGGFLASQFKLRSVGLVYVLGNVLEALLLTAVGVSPFLSLALACLFLCGIFESVATAGFFADVQVRLPRDMTGSFFSVFGSAIQVCAVAGTLLGGWLVAESSIPVVALVVAGFIALPLIPYLNVYLRRSDTELIPAINGGPPEKAAR
ncbi:MFS transporter [Plantactinospora sp. KBS50]|uniref:MFS transporter n=1 Tax=Plantactinospora sp. KBS50 TaxID=2024580 RepID=UPI000BAAC6A3|nr:MFS transporter [Plantactinospora sp. KBS50]ASW53385.1 hypothetical protein CIK06_03060 [Plantactinospora sp. KBS50]